MIQRKNSTSKGAEISWTCERNRPKGIRPSIIPWKQHIPPGHGSKRRSGILQTPETGAAHPGRPGQRSISLLLALAFPAQSLIAQRGPTAGAGVFQAHIRWLLSKDRKTPRDTLSLGQADAGREKAARKKPHLPPDVVSSTGKIHFLYRIKVIFNWFVCISKNFRLHHAWFHAYSVSCLWYFYMVSCFSSNHKVGWFFSIIPNYMEIIN